MKYVSVGQSALRLVLETGADLTAESAVTSNLQETRAQICFEKPCGERGFFNAFILDAEKGVIYYGIADDSELDTAGWWQFWASVRFSDGRTAAGRPVKVYIYMG